MPTYAWICLAVFGVALLAGIVWVTVHAVRAWRRAWPSVKQMSDASSALTARTTALEQRIASLEGKTATLQRDVDRLSVSIAQARILIGPVMEAKTLLNRIRAFTPK